MPAPPTPFPTPVSEAIGFGEVSELGPRLLDVLVHHHDPRGSVVFFALRALLVRYTHPPHPCKNLI